MSDLETIIATIDYAIDTDRKKHITGGILLSVSLLFGGLAFTVMTTKTRKDEQAC